MSVSKKLKIIADNVSRVFDAGHKVGEVVGQESGYQAGYIKGEGDGYSSGYEHGLNLGTEQGYTVGYDQGIVSGKIEGQQAEHDRFWNSYQTDGTRTSYVYAFASDGWNEDTFFPKHDINVASCQYMFSGSKITNLEQRLKDCNVTMDTTNVVDLYNFSPNAAITHFPEVGGSKLTNINNAFQNCRGLVSINKLTLSTTASCSCSSAFNNCNNLVEVRFNNGIRPTNLNIRAASKLSRASLESLIGSVADDHTTTVTVSAVAVDAAFPDRTEWDALCNTKQNLTVTEV